MRATAAQLGPRFFSIAVLLLLALCFGCQPSERTLDLKDKATQAAEAYLQAVADFGPDSVEAADARKRAAEAFKSWTDSTQGDFLENRWVRLVEHVLVTAFGGAVLWKGRNMTRARDLARLPAGG